MVSAGGVATNSVVKMLCVGRCETECSKTQPHTLDEYAPQSLSHSTHNSVTQPSASDIAAAAASASTSTPSTSVAAPSTTVASTFVSQITLLASSIIAHYD